MQIRIRPLTGKINFGGFSVKEEMVDLLFEAMTHSAVKSSLINGCAMLHVHAYIQCASIYIAHTNDTITRSVRARARFSIFFLGRL